MKVYVVAWNYPYEGYGEPHAVYATLEAAEKAIKGKKIGAFDETPEIFELEVQGLEYEYGTRWEIIGLPEFGSRTYPEPSLEDAKETIEQDRIAFGGQEPRGVLVRRTTVGDWEEVE